MNKRHRGLKSRRAQAAFSFLIFLVSVSGSQAQQKVVSMGAASPETAAGDVHAYFQSALPQPSVLGNALQVLSGSPVVGSVVSGPSVSAVNGLPARAVPIIEAIRQEAERLTDKNRVPEAADAEKIGTLNTKLHLYLTQALQRQVQDRAKLLDAEKTSVRLVADADKTGKALGCSVEDKTQAGDAAAVKGRAGDERATLSKSSPDSARTTVSEKIPAPQAESQRVLSGKDWVKLFTGKGNSSITWKEVTWHDWTKLLTRLSLFVFLPLQWPQVFKNIVAMHAGTLQVISILPWIGYGSGMLADLLILSWFLSQRNTGPSTIQAMGILSSSMVLTTIWLSGFMPALALFLIVPAALFGMGMAYANYKGKLSPRAWNAWSQFMNALGLLVAPIAITSTFGVSIWITMPVLGGLTALVLALKALGRLPSWFGPFWKNIGAWTATFLFMVGPIAQLWSIQTNPLNIAGISLLTLGLGTLGNLMMLGEATESKNKIWTVGSGWAVVVGGLGVLLSMLLHGALSPLILGAFAAVIAGSLGFFTWKNMKSRGQSLRQALAYLGWGHS